MYMYPSEFIGTISWALLHRSCAEGLAKLLPHCDFSNTILTIVLGIFTVTSMCQNIGPCNDTGQLNVEQYREKDHSPAIVISLSTPKIRCFSHYNLWCISSVMILPVFLFRTLCMDCRNWCVLLKSERLQFTIVSPTSCSLSIVVRSVWSSLGLAMGLSLIVGHMNWTIWRNLWDENCRR